MKQFIVYATKEYEYSKVVFAKDIADAHLQAFERPEDPEDDWQLVTDPDYDDENPLQITLIEES